MAKATAKPTSKSISEKKSILLHPPYSQMITEAISSLKDRTGSSLPAIAKFIAENYGTGLPSNFKKILSVQLKKLAKSERLVKVKNSYKISAAEKAKPVGSGVQVKKQRKDNAAGDTITAVKEKRKISRMVKTVKTNEASVVLIPKNKKKPVKTLKVESSTKKPSKMKRLSQVKTPEGMKKKRAPTPWKSVKSIKGSRTVPRKAKN
ncbi:hypothetical protein NE237_014652 [Protea cynaroides]|uniref:H15 domain-containing protein n=1 Tax=Protea cynaroides TaxID=273540 RepID=A0A9Q0KCR7_9MAGN|nr:hypothetical protein NE237_014652 [Protea cynaroides]